jgi:signal transduction histidine kinase
VNFTLTPVPLPGENTTEFSSMEGWLFLLNPVDLAARYCIMMLFYLSIRVAMISSGKTSKLELLPAAIRGFGSATTTEELLQRLTTTAVDLTGSASASVLEFDESSNCLRFVAVPWFWRQLLKDIFVPLDKSIAGWVFANNKLQIVQNVKKDPRHYTLVDQLTNFTTSSLLAVPMAYKGETIGVIEVVNKGDGRQYTEEDATLIETLATYAAMVLGNINLEKRIQETRNEFAELDRMKSNFIAITSHELRTPLGLILGHATFLRETISPDHREPMDTIIRNATRLKEIIESLTEVDNYEAGVARIRQNSISIPSIIRDVVASFQDMAASKNITLQEDIRDEDLQVEADANKITVAVSNLIRNALTFTNTGGQVQVMAESVTGHVQVSVKDDGIGIPASDLGRIFDRFFQVESHLTRRHTGMGLGLSVAKSMIELHGGRIWVESVEGKGSTFSFLLPLRPTQAKPSEKAFIT